jgi:monofunctional biosynthetic peptidoglycan transglycosylase
MTHTDSRHPDPHRPRRLLTDFRESAPALEWFTVLDGVMGGRSDGRIQVTEGRLQFSGRLNTDGGGFASLRSRPAALGLGDADGIILRCRGDGRTYTMLVQQGDDDRLRGVSYRADFRTGGGEAWQEVWLPFERFVPMWRGRRLERPPLEPARIDSLGLMIADRTDGPFRIELDALYAFGSPPAR